MSKIIGLGFDGLGIQLLITCISPLIAPLSAHFNLPYVL